MIRGHIFQEISLINQIIHVQSLAETFVEKKVFYFIIYSFPELLDWLAEHGFKLILSTLFNCNILNCREDMFGLNSSRYSGGYKMLNVNASYRQQKVLIRKAHVKARGGLHILSYVLLSRHFSWTFRASFKQSSHIKPFSER